MKNRAALLAAFSTLLSLACLVAPTASAQEAPGSLSGKVLDLHGRHLPGAVVTVDGSRSKATTDATGTFALRGLEPGTRSVRVTYLGFETTVFEVEVASGTTSERDLVMENASFTDDLTVTAQPFLQGQAKALNQQKNADTIQNLVSADQIGRFPDPNAAEATQRIPGITLIRDQGEGRYVVVRGTEARLNSMTINGERVPSPEGGGREVALDVVPADLLESIQVSKSLTPDMDGDAIGGVVNLVTKIAPEEMRISASVGGGYNDLADDDLRLASATFGRRLADGKVGLVLSGSTMETNRATDNFEVEYDDGFLDDLQVRDYVVTRERDGLVAGLDFQPSNDSSIRFDGIYNEFGDQEFRRRNRPRPGNGRIERELKDRYEVQEIYSVSASGNKLFGTSAMLDYRVSYAGAGEDEPVRFDTTFRQNDVEFAPNVTPTSIDRNNIQANPLNEDFDAFFLDDIVSENNTTNNRDIVARVDLSIPFDLGEGPGGILKFGVKNRDKSKDRDINVDVFEADDVFLSDWVDTRFQNPEPHFGGRYSVGPMPAPNTPRDLISGLGLEGERDLEEDLADYETDEQTLAAYGMATLSFGDRLLVVGGLRWEGTDSDYIAKELRLDEEGDPAGLTEIRGNRDYDEFLPMVNIRYQLDENSNLRAAATRTLARPNFSDLAPFQLLAEEDLEIVRGNPDLDVTTSWNVDLLYERYLETVGVVSAGVFYKDLSDNIFLFSFDERRGSDLFEVEQPLNGEGAEVLGAEFAYQNQFRNLPGLWQGLGLYLNATFADSEASYPERDPTRLQGQADLVGNLAVSYEYAGFSGRVSLNYQSDLILAAGSSASRDQFLDDRSQVDLTLRQQLTPKFALGLELLNLTDEPYRVFEGDSSRTIQEEIYSWSAALTLKVNF